MKGQVVARRGHNQPLSPSQPSPAEQEAELLLGARALASVLTRVAVIGGAICASLTVYQLLRSWKRKRDAQRAK